MQRVLSAGRVAAVVGGTRLSAPLYAALAAQLRGAITDGRLPAGARMPSERELMKALGLSRSTVTRAFTELRDQGYLRTRRGSGSVVHLPLVPGGRVDHLLTPAAGGPGVIDLTTTASSAGPWLMEAYAHALQECPRYLSGVGYYPTGLPALRELVAQDFARRGLPTRASQILITPGALSGTAIAAQALLSGPGSRRIVIESPTYPNAIATLRGLRAQLVAHSVDHERPAAQWDPAGLEVLLRQIDVRTAYLVPDFHNPSGALMDEEQRQRVATVLRRAAVVPIIDETPVDLACEDIEMPPPLAAFVPDSITVGGVSKTFWGGLRIGWMRVPSARTKQIATHRLRLDLGAPVLEQLAVAELLRRRDEILPARREAFTAGRDLLAKGVRTHLPAWRVDTPPGGLSLWCELPTQSSTALTAAAAQHGVTLAAGPNFSPTGGMDQWMRLPYVQPQEQLSAALPRLVAAWEDTLASGPMSNRDGICVGRRRQSPRLIA
ncbi:MAG: PLP-dependent aminotransferase family protein [Ornithinimicrobium sp.]